MLKSLLKRLLIIILVLNTALIGFPSLGLASPIDTMTVINMEERTAHLDRIRDSMTRDDVRSTLIGMGVNPLQAELRLDALTDAELVMLNQQMDEMPAGGSALGVLGAVLLVLIVLELLGVTNVFTKL
ncbi:MAG: PA2779 family protein [Candidatus Thiodiazotropha sp.]